MGQRCRLPMSSTQYPMAIVESPSRAVLGMARTGDLASAKEEIEAMKVCARLCSAPTSPTGPTALKSKCLPFPIGSH